MLRGPTTASRVLLTPVTISRKPPLKASASPLVASRPSTAAWDSILASVIRARMVSMVFFKAGAISSSGSVISTFMATSPSEIRFIVPMTMNWSPSAMWFMAVAISPISSLASISSRILKCPLLISLIIWLALRSGPQISEVSSKPRATAKIMLITIMTVIVVVALAAWAILFSDLVCPSASFKLDKLSIADCIAAVALPAAPSALIRLEASGSRFWVARFINESRCLLYSLRLDSKTSKACRISSDWIVAA